jgi:hypothetical protein
MADCKSKDHESNETSAGGFCDEASNSDLFYGRTLRHPEIEEMFSGPSIAADALRSATGRWLAMSNMARLSVAPKAQGFMIFAWLRHSAPSERLARRRL